MASRSRTTQRLPRPAASPTGDARRRFRFRPSLLVLEPRTLLSNLVVTNTNDSGSGSLRYEISQAANGDNITFSSLFSSAQTITLTSGVLDITRAVTIDGPGASLLTISGNHSQGVFDVTAGSASQPVTLSGLTVANGFSGAHGGGIFNDRGTLTLTDCTVSNNSAFGNGGGIYNARGTLSLTDCTVSGNSTTGFGSIGGGIVSGLGTLTMTACIVSGNSADDFGGIFTSTGTLTMTACTVSGNTGQFEGGGLFNGGTANLLGCTILGNVAKETLTGNSISGSGGGVLNEGTLTLTSCVVSENWAAHDGAGIANIAPSQTTSYPLSLTMTDSTVAINTAEGEGGGIYNGPNFSLDMTNCTISRNQSIEPAVNGQGIGGNGGGIFSGGKLVMTNCTVHHNQAINGNLHGIGGGLESIGPSAVLTNCTLTSNTASITGGLYGGDIDISPNGTLILHNCIIANSKLLGGDIAGTVTGRNNFVDDPQTAGGLMDGVFGNIVESEDPLLSVPGFYGGPTATVVPLSGSPVIGKGSPSLIPAGITTDQRGAPRTRGGAVDIGAVESGPITITVTTLADAGLGPIIDGPSTSLRQAIAFADADAYAGDTITFTPGLGLTDTLALKQGALPAITGSVTIAGPGHGELGIDAQGNSGILAIASGAKVAVSGLVLTNGSSSSGGAIINQGTLALTACLLSGNTAANGGGIENDGTLTLTGCIIKGNTATGSGSGGGIDNHGTLTLTSSSISGNTASLGGGIDNHGTLKLTDSGIGGNTAGNGGGIENDAALTLTGSTISDNTANQYGGGIDNHGTLTLIGCTLSGDTANRGGAIYNYGTLTVADSTLSANSAIGPGASPGAGGAVFSSGPTRTFGTLMMTNCTIAGNSAYAGGGILIDPTGITTLINCTIAGNSGTFGGGVNNRSFVTTLDNTIVADNPGGDIDTPVSGSNNLIDDPATAGGFTNGVDGNLVGLDPKLGPLANNGGPTRTMALLAGSPAIDAGSDSLVPSGVTTDQRGAPRIKGSTVDIGAFESGEWSLTVTTLADSGGNGRTLRQAIDEVNTIDPIGPVAITFAPGLTGTLDLTQGMLPPIAGNLAIDGPGANLLTIDAQGQSSILFIEPGATVSLSGLTLAHGSAVGGGAIDDDGTLLMSGCTVAGNSAWSGGGIENTSLGTLTLIGCTVSGNSATRPVATTYGGGGIVNVGTATLINCTVAGNSTTGSGGGIDNYAGTLTLADCTVAGNSAGAAGGIDNHLGQVTLDNTIVADNPAGGDLRGAFSGSNNLIDDAATAGGLANGVDGNLVGLDPKLGPLQFNGGPTLTMALLPTSPAIGQGAISLVPAGILSDERGSPRFKGGAVDIGAVESGPTTIFVTSLADVDNGAINLFDPAGITLREAIAFADADPSGGDTIIFSPLVTGTIDLSLGALPTITTALTIDGPGANVLTIDGQGRSGILSVASGADVTISGLTLADGSAAAGGGILNQGTLTLNGCTLSGNTADSGGGIASNGTVTLTDCTISGNSAAGSGGGFYNYSGTATLTDCTISGNTAGSSAGLMLVNGTNTLVSCTVSANTDTSTSSGLAAGLYLFGSATLNNTIVAGNTGPSGASDLGGPGAATGSNNLIGTGSVSGSNNQLGVTNPMLGPLAWNGGPTRTMALLTGSPAIGKGATGSVTEDQRGFALDSPTPDVGAFQYQGPPLIATITGPTSATAQVAMTFTLTAADPIFGPDPGATYTYTVDWNGDGSDVQTIQGPASMQVAHAYLAAGPFTPIVTVLGPGGRSSLPAALAAPVVVTALTPSTFVQSIVQNQTTIVASTSLQAATALETINNAPASAWNGSNSVTLAVAHDAPVLDVVVNPTSPDAQVNYDPYNTATVGFSGLVNPFNPYLSGISGQSRQDLIIAETVIATAAAAIITAGVGAGFAAGSIVPLFMVEEAGLTTAFTATSMTNLTMAALITAGVVGSAGGAAGGSLAAYNQTQSEALGASPALIVDQGKVNWSGTVFSTATDSPTIVVRGGTLNLQDNFLARNSASQPIIEVDGGTLILGSPDGTHGDAFGAFGSAPFVHVAGTGMLIVEPGNAFDQITSDLTAQAAGSTITQLVSSAPAALPGQAVTLTATVTAAGAPATDGTVEFFDDTTHTFLGTAPVSNGSASLPVTFHALTAGDTIYATYLPTTGALAPSSGHVTQAVVAATATTVTGPTSTPVYGQTVTFTATVTDTTSSGGTPTGSVEFFDGSTDLGPGTALSGSGNAVTSTFSIATLTAGTHTIEAVYTPTGAFQATSGTLSQAVDPATPTITWNPPADIVYGTPLSSTQLDAAAGWTIGGSPVTVAGTFTYTPPAGTVLHQGPHTLSEHFVPSDTVDYNTPADQTVVLNVQPAAPSFSGLTALPTIVYGTPTITLQGVLSAPTAIPVGQSVTVSVDGVTSSATVAADGSFTATLDTQTIPAVTAPYPITYSYVSSDPDFRSASDTSTALMVNKDATTTVVAGPGTADFGQAVTITATVTAKAPGSGTPTGTVTFVDSTTGNTLGTAALSGGTASVTVSNLPPGAQSIVASYGGDGNFLAGATATGSTVTVLGSVIVLDPAASGALLVSGSASVTTPGLIAVDSSSSSALVESGGQVKAGSIQVVGGVKISGGSISPAPATGAKPLADPLAGLPVPSPGPSSGAVNLSSGSKTISPGLYTAITVSNGAKLTMNPGIYEIAGGGFNISGSAQVTGSGVLIYNAGSHYPTGTGGTYGAINVSGQAVVQLSAPATGVYAGIVIFQSRDNARPLAFSGSAAADLGGLVYAPAAVATVSGSLPLEETTLVVDALQVTGTGSVIPYPASGGSSVVAPTAVVAPAAAAPQGPLGLAAASAPAGPGTVSRSDRASRPNGIGSTAVPVSLAASSRPVAMGLASGAEGDDPSSLDDSEILADVAVSLIAGRSDGIEGSVPAREKART